ncbi:MAG: transcription-repair coupling factor [bacterium]
MPEIHTLQDLDHLWKAMITGEERSVCFTGLPGASRTLVLTQLQETLSHPLLIITSTPSEAEKVFKDLNFFFRGAEAAQKEIPDLCLFPQWEVLPYDDKSPHPEIVKNRLSVLSRLVRGERLMVITTIRAVLQRILPGEVLQRGSLDVRTGSVLDPDTFTDKISRCGYRRTDLVDMPGTFSRRGGILDIFPPNQPCPFRIEFFGDEIESIRVFSPKDQRSFDTVPGMQTILSREILLDTTAIDHFKKHAGADEHPLTALLDQMEAPEGAEFYAPLFHPNMETLFDYMPEQTIVVLDQTEEIQDHAESFGKEIEERHALARCQDRLPCKIAELYMDIGELYKKIKDRRSISFALLPREGEKEIRFNTESTGSLVVPGKSRISSLCEAVRKIRTESRICIAVRTPGQANRIMELLSKEEEIPCARHNRCADLPDEKGIVGIVVGSLSAGFRFPLFGLVCITDDEIFGVKRVHRPSRLLREGPFLSNLSELREGNLVVHLDHGIGRYRGLREVRLEGMDCDLILIEYAGGDLLYVPPEKIRLLQKYSGSEGHSVRVDRLGGTGWDKLKQKVKKSIEEMSRELIELYAQRKVAQGIAFSPPDPIFREFEETFEYEETPDQRRAIEEVLEDMQKPTPMDRLVCGDVGFGKTEVAIRAAFKAVLDGRQVAVLVPTTLLAQQHYDSFTRRFSAFPVKVEMLSRFRPRKEQKNILEKLRLGQVDILIGTHRLLSRDVLFKDLGLTVIDEEQRFGVRHKEKLKQFRKEVDVLTLTATPIPRTLEMAFLGIRDISIINTPPDNRLSIYTKVARFSEEIIREAVLRELDRDGQVFFVHNRVHDIHRMADHIHRIVPESRIDVAHGQMQENRLKEVMDRFLDKKIDLLVTTSIIQSGLDIPNANTMIIHRPEEFGLGQLYQLRGRIGRMDHRAYAYLLTRSEKSMSEEARRRLQVIQELTELGSGFQLAARDLDIRGSGNLLGPQQSGFIAAMGFDLYMQLVDEVAAEQKGEKRAAPIEPSIQMRTAAKIPKSYIREDRLRLDLYQRLARMDDHPDLAGIMDEIRDRFGPHPMEMENLFRIIELRILARRLCISEIVEQDKRILFTFDKETPVQQESILQIIRNAAVRIRPVSEFQLELLKPEGNIEEPCSLAKNLLQELI